MPFILKYVQIVKEKMEVEADELPDMKKICLVKEHKSKLSSKMNVCMITVKHTYQFFLICRAFTGLFWLGNLDEHLDLIEILQRIMLFKFCISSFKSKGIKGEFFIGLSRSELLLRLSIILVCIRIRMKTCDFWSFGISTYI